MSATGFQFNMESSRGRTVCVWLGSTNGKGNFRRHDVLLRRLTDFIKPTGERVSQWVDGQSMRIARAGRALFSSRTMTCPVI